MRIISCISIFLFCVTGRLIAQDNQKDWSFYSREKRLEWNNSHPYLLASGLREFYQAHLSYNYGEGDLHKVFETSQFSTVKFSSQSQKAIGNWAFNGSFDYEKNLKSVRDYLLQSDNEDQNPYRLADTHSGPWSGGRVDFSLAVLSPSYFRAARSFVRIEYTVGSSNRNNEPRPLYRHNRIYVQLGQLIALKDWLDVGMAGFYRQTKEENLIGSYATQDLVLYQLRGLGTFSKNTFRSFQRNQEYDTYGLHLFSRIKRKNYKGFIDISVAQGDFTARNAIVNPVNSGELNLVKSNITIGSRIMFNEKAEWQSDLKIDYGKTEGIDPVFKAINYESETHSIAFSNLLLMKDRNHQLGADLYYSNEERSDLAGNDRVKYQFLETEATYLFYIGKIFTQGLYLKPMLGYRKSIEASLSTSAFDLAREILIREQDFFKTDYFKGALEMEWKKPFGKQTLLINARLTRHQNPDTAYSYFNLRTGLVF
ncbi:DUF6850 family outer membrane beta-barrel protein [Sinomicrobium soli]|uniref:DUF6850 family outer membrane beta-barrel protein n=1 Tax=Sinomicrobium sp. N-1-3-6 TaxID=2219864 RepID=UPI000DCE5F2E|nr:DUF6850 family outer membrane beta-barrel protein [Sinomicrobium sp. N-1-3-6]RAV28971.1 hypothetical protein DN748_11320 [Sinomicrobium sp. N-1-3-6]